MPAGRADRTDGAATGLGWQESCGHKTVLSRPRAARRVESDSGVMGVVVCVLMVKVVGAAADAPRGG